VTLFLFMVRDAFAWQYGLFKHLLQPFFSHSNSLIFLSSPHVTQKINTCYQFNTLFSHLPPLLSHFPFNQVNNMAEEGKGVETHKALDDFDPPKKPKTNFYAFGCAILASTTCILLGYGQSSYLYPCYFLTL